MKTCLPLLNLKNHKMKKIINWIRMQVFMSIKNKSFFLVLILFCSCTKNNFNERQETQIIKSEVVDLSLNSSMLNAALSPVQWNMALTQKITYSNGLYSYHSQSKIDKTKTLVRWTVDNFRWVETIVTDSTSKYGTGYIYQVLRSPTGLKYYSMDIRESDKHYANLIVENELPLYTLKLVFIPIGGAPAKEQRKWFDCIKSRIYVCRTSWKCGLSCGTFVTVGGCGLLMAASCYKW